MRKKKSELPTCFNFVSMFFIVIIPTSYCLLPAELGSNVAEIMEAGVGGGHCLCSWRYIERRRRRPVKHRRSETRQRARNAAARASGRVITCGFFFLSRLAPTRLLLEPIHTESGRLGPKSAVSAVSADMAVSAETPDSGRNSKKRVQNTPFQLNLKPSFSLLHTNTPNFLYYL